MKYEVGDKVRIKPKFHFCSVDGFNNINMKDEFFNEYSRLPYCETVMTIGIVNKDFYILKEDKWAYKWTDEMIEGLVEEEIIDIDDFQEDNEIIDIIDEYVHRLKNNECQINLPEGYQFTDENGNVINATKIVLEKKKKEYPKTFYRCVRTLGLYSHPADASKHKTELIRKLQTLLVCRDAYWKIAGEEMGLGKPWEPDWGKGACYTICCNTNQIVIGTDKFRNAILAFPTKEMRDAFKENFDPDIEFCKELL